MVWVGTIVDCNVGMIKREDKGGGLCRKGKWMAHVNDAQDTGKYSLSREKQEQEGRGWYSRGTRDGRTTAGRF